MSSRSRAAAEARPQAARPGLARRLAAEALGTAYLLAAVVGSGIMAERLAGGNLAIALLANTLATAAALAVLIQLLAPVSGAHFNPAVTLVSALSREMRPREAACYVVAQLAGALAGVGAAHLMFALPLYSLASHVRAGPAQMLGELVASFGLIGVILGGARRNPAALPYAVACYIAAAYWFTSSTSFANPAVALARALSDSFSGIRPLDAPGFIVAELAGAALAKPLFDWLIPPEPG